MFSLRSICLWIDTNIALLVKTCRGPAEQTNPYLPKLPENKKTKPLPMVLVRDVNFSVGYQLDVMLSFRSVNMGLLQIKVYLSVKPIKSHCNPFAIYDNNNYCYYYCIIIIINTTYTIIIIL